MTTEGSWQRLEGAFTEVWRDGAKLRRQRREFSTAIHALLKWYEARGISQVPRSLGFEGDREILSFIGGTAISRPWPQEVLTDAFVRELGTLVRRLHDASVGFALSADERFSFGPARPSWSHVVCHGDLGPWNVVVRDGRISGIIDWDFAHFGDPLEDLIWLALDFAPLREIEVSAEELSVERKYARLKSLCNGYGGVSADDLVAAAPAFLVSQAAQIRRLATEGNDLFAQLVSRNIPNELEMEAKQIQTRFVLPLSGTSRTGRV